jgi:hypothetical protein
MPKNTYGDNSTELMLYVNYIQDEEGNMVADGYAYGEPWVAQALYMDDLKFDTPEKAKEWWEKNYGQN